MKNADDLYRQLGFTRIRQNISERCRTEYARDEALVFRSFMATELRDHERRLLQEMRDYILKEGQLGLIAFNDPLNILDRLAVEGSVLPEAELYGLLQYLKESRRIRDRFVNRKENYKLLAKMLELGVAELQQLYKPMLAIFNDEGRLLDKASALLGQLRRRIQQLQGRIREKADKIAREAVEDNISSDPQVAFRNGRPVIPVKSSRKNRIPGIIHDQSQSGQTFYIEPMVIVEMNNELKEAELAEQDEVYRILFEKTAELRGAHADITAAVDLYHHIDLLHAKAVFAVDYHCEAPVRDNDGFYLKAARNLELQFMREVVPLNIRLESDTRAVVVTGPNAGGKTVTLKTLGLIALMNQAGLLLPADYADIPDFSRIFIDIGDGQSIDGDLSTYSSHISRLKDILENADENSLILLDELGTGTDPDEGAALAESVLTHLRDMGALVIATTHHSALKSFAYNNPGMINASMTFNDKDLAPTYEFKLGIPGSSYAIEIARRYKIPEAILKQARERIGKGREKLEKLITDLQRKIHRYDSDLSELRQKDAGLREKKEKIDRQKKEIDAKYKKADREALKQAQEFVNTMYSDFERTIQEIKSSNVTAAAIKKARTELAGIEKNIEKRSQKATAAKESVMKIGDLSVGDMVWVKNMEQNAVVREINLKTQRIWVDISGTRMRLDIDWLSPAKKTEQKVQTAFSNSGPPASYRLDIRGYRMENAISELDKFMDHAVLSGLYSVEILHGKGDGILKKTVEDLLPEDPRVLSFDTAPVEQGGAGVTVVKLKK